MVFVFFALLFAAGSLIFCFVAGFVLFRFLCVRSVYEKNSYVDKTDHVKDEKIINVLFEAKTRWKERPLEKVTITSAPLQRIFLFPGKKPNLCGDLWIQKQAERRRFAVLVHGFSDSASGMAYLAESYYERGFSVLCVNLRAHSESGGKYAGLGYLTTDAADIALWLEHLVMRFGENCRIVLHGVSMGATTVVQCAYGIIAVRERYAPVRRCLKLTVADCGFFRFSDQVENQLKLFLSSGNLQNIIFKVLCFSASFINVLVNGFGFFEDSPEKSLRALKENKDFALLLFHGSADTLVPPKAARQLYEAAPEPKKLVLTEKAPHIGSWFYDKEKYMEEIILQFKLAENTLLL